MLTSVASPALQYFSTFSHKRHYFPQKKKLVIEHKMCVLIFSAVLSEIFLILRRTQRGMIKCVYWSSCTVAVILVRFKCNLNFLGRFSTDSQVSNSKLSTSCVAFKLVVFQPTP